MLDGGVLIATRCSYHLTGWLLCAVGLLLGVNHFCGKYAIYALLTRPDSLPGGRVSAWVASWPWMPANALLVFVALLFPDGRLPSRRWAPFAWLNVVVAVVGTIAVAFLPGPIPALGPIENPFGIEGSRNILGPIATISAPLERGILGLIVVASLFLRLSSARGDKREQIKWFAYAASVVAIGAILTYVAPGATGIRWVGQVGLALLAFGFVSLPIAITIAILRYRLYDIDLIINRTLVYGSLTVVLAGLFEVVDAALGHLLVALTRQDSLPGSIIAAFVITALFNPVRHCIQNFVDRYVSPEETMASQDS